MNVLEGHIGVRCFVFLDDVIIYSESDDDHLKDVQMIIERLRQYNLKIKLSKCKFAKRKIEYLSHIIHNGTLSTNPEKVSAVTNFKRPTTVKQLQSFLGLISYYRKFIKNCSTLASPLIKLTEKSTDYIWTNECEISFQTLKHYLVSNDHVLALPDFSKPFVIEVDASKYGLGGVLSQKVGRHFKPCAYFSKHLTKTERNYSTSEREMLAIVLSVEKFKQYVYGQAFTILSDHEPLKFLTTSDVPAPRLARLQKRLSIYNYTIEYRAGKKNGNADALSRMCEENSNELTESDDTIMINAMYLTNDSNFEQTDDANLKWIIDLMTNNDRKPLINNFSNAEQRSLYLQWDRLKLIKNKLYREYIDKRDVIIYQYIVPSSKRDYVLANMHDTAVCGHLGYEKTRDRIKHKFYWYLMDKQILSYVQNCVSCQTNKVTNKYNITKMKPIFATRPNEIICTDVMGPITQTPNGYKYILVICDHFTKYSEFFPMKSVTASETAKRIIEYISRHSVPDSILSDRGTNFQSVLLSEIIELLDIHKLNSSPHYPVCNGQVERMNRSIQAMLTSYVNEHKTNWDEFLPLINFAYNSAVHKTTQYSPFELTYGRSPRLPLDLLSSSDQLDLYLSFDSYAREIQTKFAIAYEHVAKNTDVSIKPHVINHDRKVRACEFKKDDYCWLLDENKVSGVCKKLSAKYKGPYRITEVIDECNYKIKHIRNSRQTIVNKCKLKRCFPRNILLTLNDADDEAADESQPITNDNHLQSNSNDPPIPIPNETSNEDTNSVVNDSNSKRRKKSKTSTDKSSANHKRKKANSKRKSKNFTMNTNASNDSTLPSIIQNSSMETNSPNEIQLPNDHVNKRIRKQTVFYKA